MSDHDEIDIDRVRERVKRHLHHRPVWQFMLLIWIGIMLFSGLMSGIGYMGYPMRGRFSWGGSPWVVFFLIILLIGWLQRRRFSSRSSTDEHIEELVRREVQRERERMATGDWDDSQNDAVYEKRKRVDEAEPPELAHDVVAHLGDDGELIFDDKPDANDEAEQHHSAVS